MDKLTKTYQAGHAQVWRTENDGSVTWTVDDARTGLTYSRIETSFRDEADAIEAADRFAAKEIAKQTTPAAPATEARTYHTKTGGLYGEGRVYTDQPGATQYRGLSGKYDVQIWDES